MLSSFGEPVADCSLSFLLSSDTRGTWSGLAGPAVAYLLKGSCIVHLLHTLVVTNTCLSCFCLPISSSQSGNFPLTSDWQHCDTGVIKLESELYGMNVWTFCFLLCSSRRFSQQTLACLKQSYDCSVSFDALKPPCSNVWPPVNEMLPELKCDSVHRGGQHLLSCQQMKMWAVMLDKHT